MVFAEIIKEMSKFFKITIISYCHDWAIQDVALIDNTNTHYSSNTLYFGYDTQTFNSSIFPPQCILADASSKIPGMSTGELLSEHTECNIALVPETDLFSIFNHIKTFIESSRSRGLFEELALVADETRSLDAVLNTASVRLGCSLIFNDMTFKILASSKSVPVIDPLWQKNIRQGYCNYDFIHAVKQLEPLKNAALTTTAIEVSCPESPYRKLSSKVFLKGTQIGFILMIEGETPFLPSHREMLGTVSLALSYAIARYLPDLPEGPGPYQQILYDMLIGAPTKELLPRLKNMTFPDRMAAAYLRPAQYLGQHYLREHTTAQLNKTFPGALVTYHKNGIAAVLPLSQESEIPLQLLEEMNILAETEHVRVGVSNPFSNIDRFATYFDQAYQALEFGQRFDPDHVVCCYMDYQLFSLFSEFKDPENLGRFCHPALSRLRKYDHQNKTRLYETLYVYLETGCSIKATSERLYIHRNSLVYRLNRITEVCQFDLGNTNTRLLLRISYLIDKFNGMHL